MMLTSLAEAVRRKSAVMICLLAVGVIGWLTPTMASARRLRKAERDHVALVSPQEIVLPVSTESTEVCVQGTAIAGQQRVAVIDGRVVAVGQRISTAGRKFSVVEIESESVRLREVAGDEEPLSFR